MTDKLDELRRGVGMDLSRPYLDEQARIRVGMGGGEVDDLPLFGGNDD